METVKYIGQPKKWFTDCHFVDPMKPIGYLRHEPTGYSLAVYKPISDSNGLCSVGVSG